MLTVIFIHDTENLFPSKSTSQCYLSMYREKNPRIAVTTSKADHQLHQTLMVQYSLKAFLKFLQDAKQQANRYQSPQSTLAGATHSTDCPC